MLFVALFCSDGGDRSHVVCDCSMRAVRAYSASAGKLKGTSTSTAAAPTGKDAAVSIDRMRASPMINHSLSSHCLLLQARSPFPPDKTPVPDTETPLTETVRDFLPPQEFYELLKENNLDFYA